MLSNLDMHRNKEGKRDSGRRKATWDAPCTRTAKVQWWLDATVKPQDCLAGASKKYRDHSEEKRIKAGMSQLEPRNRRALRDNAGRNRRFDFLGENEGVPKVSQSQQGKADQCGIAQFVTIW